MVAVVRAVVTDDVDPNTGIAKVKRVTEKAVCFCFKYCLYYLTTSLVGFLCTQAMDTNNPGGLGNNEDLQYAQQSHRGDSPV